MKSYVIALQKLKKQEQLKIMSLYILCEKSHIFPGLHQAQNALVMALNHEILLSQTISSHDLSRGFTYI